MRCPNAGVMCCFEPGGGMYVSVNASACLWWVCRQVCCVRAFVLLRLMASLRSDVVPPWAALDGALWARGTHHAHHVSIPDCLCSTTLQALVAQRWQQACSRHVKRVAALGLM